MGLFRRRTRAQNDREVVAKQSGFLGGMNLDNPSSEIDETEVAYLENLIPFRSYLKTRSGVKTYGALPGSGELHSIFEHEGNLKFVCHVGSELYYSADNMATWALIGGEAPADSESDMKALSDDVLFFQEDRIFRIEMENTSGVIARPLNEDNPTEFPIFDGVSDSISGNHLYRYTYTFARLVDDELVAESGSLQPAEAIDPDYVEVYTENPISEYEYPTISTLSVPVGTYWTHIRLYRTLDIHPDVGGVNSSEIFYLVNEIPLAQVEGIDEGIDFDFIIDDTIPEDDPTQPSPLLEVGVGDSFATPDSTLIAGGEILKTRFFRPIPDGIVNEVTPGFVFVAKRNAKKVYYSSVGDVPRRVGYYQPAFQFSSIDDSARLIVGNPDSIIILCNKSTYRGTIFTERNVGNANVGEVIPQLESFTVIDDDVGVYDYGSVAKMDTGRFIALCSDSSVRVWEGRQWGIDVSQFKVQDEIKKIHDGSAAVYNSDGYYLLWYSTDKSSTVREKCLRYGLAEDIGKGWSFFSGDSFPFPKKNVGTMVSIDPVEKKQLILCYDNVNHTMVQVETFDGPVGSNYARSDVDLEGEPNESNIKSKVTFRELTGSLESYFCIHQQSNIYVRPVSRDLMLSQSFGVDVKISVDGSNNKDSAISVDSAGDAFFFKESAKVTGHRIQISVESNTNSEGFILRGYDTRYRVQDRRDLKLTSSENAWQSEMSNMSKLWLSRPLALINRIDAKSLTINAGAQGVISSPDGRVHALELSADFHAQNEIVYTNSNIAISLWMKNVQTLFDKTITINGQNVLYAGNPNAVYLNSHPFGAPGAIDLSVWNHIYAIINGTTGTVYSNGVLVGTATIPALTSNGVIEIFGGTKELFDIRVFEEAPSIEAINYYIDDILTNEGRISLPMG